MNEENLFSDFKDYIKNNNYQLKVNGEKSLGGFKDTIEIILFYDHSKYQYVLRVIDDGYKLFNVLFVDESNNYKLNHKNNEDKKFLNIHDVIDYANKNISIKI